MCCRSRVHSAYYSADKYTVKLLNQFPSTSPWKWFCLLLSEKIISDRAPLFCHCASVCCGWYLPGLRVITVFCDRLHTWHFHDSCPVWWLAWRLAEPLLRQNQAAYVCMGTEHFLTTVYCVHACDYNCDLKKKDFGLFQSLKPNFVQSVLTHCVNHAIYFAPKLYSGMHPHLQLEFSTHTHFRVKFCLFLYRTCAQSGTHYFSETHTACAVFSCFREMMQSALHAYVSVLWGNDSGYE